MSVIIRKLTKEDFHFYKQMENKLKNDYILEMFNQLTEEPHTLFGLFSENNLIATAGYSIYAKQYAMIGRFRSDRRYRKKGYGTQVLSYALNEALKHPGVKWAGGNTEKHNKAALAVLNKLGLPPIVTLYPAQTTDVSPLAENEEPWEIINSTARKKEWIEQTYLNPDFEKDIFPYEAYYPFPASSALFEGTLDHISFFENESQTRYLMMWQEEKDKEYLHVVYPWSDFINQSGFFETLHSEFQTSKQKGAASTLWFDLTEEEIHQLPDKHPFKLLSPWILHGISKEEYMD